MLKKDLLKEGWITFTDDVDLESEISNIELARDVYEADKNHKKYGKKINKYLKKRIDNLYTFQREIENVKSISIVRGANINNNTDFRHNYLIIEDKYGPNVILDLNEGIDESYRFRKLYLNKHTKIEKLYTDDGRKNQGQLSSISSVKYYPKATLVNDYSKSEVIDGYLLEITDTLDNKLFIGCLNKNMFYNRNNYSIINDLKEIELFNNGMKLSIPKRILDIKYYLLNIFTETDE